MTVKRYGAGIILTFMILFLLTAMLLLSFYEGAFDAGVFLWGVMLAAIVLLQYNILGAAFRYIDRVTLLIADFLCVIGFVMLYRMNPQAGQRQFVWILAGNAAMVTALCVVRRVRDFGKANNFFIAAGILMLGLTLALAQTQLGTRNWVQVGPFRFQPSEFVKVLFLIVTAYYLSVKKRKRDMWPYFLFTVACVGMLVIARDLGAAMLFSGTFLIVFYVATGHLGVTLLSLGAFAGGAALSYGLFDHVKTRVEVWKDPWAAYDGKGYQIVQGLLAIASGGVLGTGLGNGMPTSIPVHETDYIFAAIAEEFGLVAAIAVIAFYLVFVVRGVLIAMGARTKFHKLLVFGSTCMLALQSFIIIGGVIKLIPLTGITMPFVSLGGSSMISSMILLGMIEGVAQGNGEQDAAELAEMGGGME